MSLAARQSLRSLNHRTSMLFAALFLSTTLAAHALADQGEVAPPSIDATPATKVIMGIASGISDTERKIMAQVMRAYDRLLVREEDELEIITRKTHESTAIDPDDADAVKANIEFYRQQATHRMRIKIAIKGGDNPNDVDGQATLLSASYERFMPYAHVVLPGENNPAYEIIDIARFGAGTLTGDELERIYAVKQIVAKQHINEGPLHPVTKRPTGRDVVVVLIDSSSPDNERTLSFGDKRIIGMQAFLKPVIEDGQSTNIFNQKTRDWLKAFRTANYERPTKQDMHFGNACGIAQAAIALCMAHVTLSTGIDTDGVFDVFPAALSYGFGTVVGIWSRTYRNFTQWGNDSDRVWKTSVIGLLFAYTITVHRGVDAVALDFFSNVAHSPLAATGSLFRGYANVLGQGVGRMLGTAGILTAIGVHAHIMLNNKLSNWAKVAFHRINLIRDKSMKSTAPMLYPANPHVAMANFIARAAKSLTLGSLDHVNKMFPYATQDEHDDMRLRTIAFFDALIGKIPHTKMRVTTLEQGAVEYQAVYILGHYPIKMLDLTGIKTGSLGGVTLSISKFVLVLITPPVKYLGVLYSRMILSELTAKHSPHLSEYQRTQQQIEDDWRGYKELFTSPKKGADYIKTSTLGFANGVVKGTMVLASGSVQLAAHVKRAVSQSCRYLMTKTTQTFGGTIAKR